MSRTNLAAVGAALTLAACGDGQTGAGYKGEPLMELSGVVTSSSSPLSQGLVPSLTFFPFTVLNIQMQTTYFVMSEVEGTFPSAFTMRIYDPPPEGALVSMFDGEPAFNVGQIAAVSPDHPNWLRKHNHAEPIEGIPDGQILREELCSDTGECFSGYPANCPEGQQDPSWEWPCGAAFPEEFPWEVYGYSEHYAVIYFDGDVAADSVLARLHGDGSAIAGGYHPVRFTDTTTFSPEDQQAHATCSVNAIMQGIEAANALFGTTATYPDLSQLADLDKQIELRRLNMIAYAELGCHPMTEVIADPGSEPIELPFADQPQRFTL